MCCLSFGLLSVDRLILTLTEEVSMRVRLRRKAAVTCISQTITVVPGCFKDDNASHSKSGKFNPRSFRNPWTDRHLNLHGWLRLGRLPLYKISSRCDYPPLCPPNMRKCASSDSASFLVLPSAYIPKPLHRFSRSIRQMTSFRPRMCLIGVPKTKFLHFDPIFPQNANFWPIFDGTSKISRQKGFNNGDAHLQ